MNFKCLKNSLVVSDCLITEKHKNNIKILENIQNNEENIIIKQKSSFLCSCGKSYSHRSGWSRHNSICTYVANINQPANSGEEIHNMVNILTELMKNQTDLQTKMSQFITNNSHLMNI